ncbi:MAG: tetratricopeptide repeat protein [Candidatus Bathyarchaeota archaeon]|nr:MAG: tetratricopeptide repeat protein [Candidatus Bathyarchaeota archaeon]
MKKSALVLFSISLCALISMLTISPVRADIERFTWLPPYMQKDDGVVVFKDGSAVNLLVPVNNDWYSNGMNVSKVVINFDWGQNKTLNLLDDIEQIAWHETKLFTVSFTASATEAVSSDWAHEYMIYVEHVNATTGPVEIVDTWSRSWESFWPSYRFVVFPADQANAHDLSEEYEAYASAYPTWGFGNTNASQLAGQASIKASLGDMYYSRGDYALAETQYETALELYTEALAAEMEWQTRVEEAELEIALTEAEANMAVADAMLKQADAAVNQSYAWILFGLGFVFIGIAAIVYAFRKPKAGYQVA